jgi:adenylylsulfate kinase-like enzyme
VGKTAIALTDTGDQSVAALAGPVIEPANTTIHLTLQGKGGVGKSLVAVILAQYLSKRGLQIQCIDTDPLNRTFAQYNAFAAERIQVRDEHSRIDQRSFDGLLERFLTEHGATFVVDNGASTFRFCHGRSVFWLDLGSRTVSRIQEVV